MQGYDLADVERVLSRGEWAGWDEIIDWLRVEGPEDEALTGDVDALLDDLETAQRSGVPFTGDPEETYEALTAGSLRGADTVDGGLGGAPGGETPFDDEEVWPGSDDERAELHPDDVEAY